jgi:N-methylhydantoinase B
LHIDTPGGGGYGDPLERDPEAVRQDVWDGRVSMRLAQEQYGVVLEAPGLIIDHQATQHLRATLCQRRGAITWVYDRGPLGKA